MTTSIIYGAIFLSPNASEEMLVMQEEEPENVPVHLLVKASNFKDFGWLQHKIVEEFCQFVCREITRRTPRGVFHTIQDAHHLLDMSLGIKGYALQQLHKYQAQVFTPEWTNLTIVFITSMTYPPKNLQRLFMYLIKEFRNNYPKLSKTEPSEGLNTKWVKFPELKKKIDECQDPSKVDKISKIQADLEETKKIMCKNIDELLKNNEKIEDLLMKSEDISKSSHEFLKKSKRLNRWCCIVL